VFNVLLESLSVNYRGAVGQAKHLSYGWVASIAGSSTREV